MGEIILKELRLNIINYRLFLTFLLFTSLFILSFVLMSEEYSGRVINYNNSKSINTKDLWWDTLYSYRWSGGGGTGVITGPAPLGRIKEPNPMIFFARGVDKRMRQSLHLLKSFPIIQVSFESEQDAVLYRKIFPPPDLMFMINIGLSLMALLYSYSLVNGESRAGTLKLMVSAGASRTSILAGKMIGNLVCLWISFSVAWVIWLLLFITVVNPNPSNEVWLRIISLYGVSILYSVVFFCLGLLISTMCHQPSTSLVLSLFAWIIFLFIIPGLAAIAGQHFVQVKSNQRIAEEKYRLTQQLEEEY